MKTHSKQPKNNTSALQAKAKNQAQEGVILQAYKKGIAQFQPLAEEEEPIQGKSETAQLFPQSQIVQKVDASEGWKLKKAYDTAIAAKDKDVYYNTLNQLGYPNEGDLSDEPNDPTFQFKSKVIQMARSPHAISGPKDYAGLNDVVYQCDAQGNIDFSNPSQYYVGNPYPGLNPVVAGSTVDVSNAVANYGTGNRYQHFKDANQQMPHFGGQNGSSPAGYTWHHLTTQHQMHLVDRTVHSKHGHNGGVYLW